MKKILAVLLALFVVGGALFAQATVNGYVRAIGTYSDTGFAYADRLRLNLSFTTEDKNVYFFGRLQGSSAGLTTTATFADNTLLPADADILDDVFTVKGTDIAVKYLYGRVKLFNGMLAITGGQLGNYDYNIGTGISEYSLGNVSNDGYALDGVKGMLFQVYPVEGLNLGVALLPAGTDLALENFGFNAMYTIKDIGDIVVESTMGTDFASSRYSASFKFTMVKDLTAVAGYKHAADDTASIYGIVDYSIAGVSLEVVPEYFLNTSGLYLEGYASYGIGDLTINVLGGYDAKHVNLDGDYFFGAEFLYKVSAKGLLQASINYDAVAKLSIPLVVKVSF